MGGGVMAPWARMRVAATLALLRRSIQLKANVVPANVADDRENDITGSDRAQPFGRDDFDRLISWLPTEDDLVAWCEREISYGSIFRRWLAVNRSLLRSN